MTTTKPTENYSEQQAKAQLESIEMLVKTMEYAPISDAEDRDKAFEDASQAILDDALSVEVRGGWYVPGQETDRENAAPVEFCILLCTGGPAVRLIGDLDAQNQPESVRLEHQDWGAPWTEYRDVSTEQAEAMLTYCRQFYFGE